MRKNNSLGSADHTAGLRTRFGSFGDIYLDKRSLHSSWGILVHPRAHHLITSDRPQQQCLSCDAEASPVLEATAAADLSEPSAADVPAPEAAQEPKIVDPVIQEFTDLFAALSTELQGRGYYQDRPEYTVPNKSRSELGVEKRALLTMARERIDILYSLPTDKLKAIASNELPYVDRKVLLSPQFCCNPAARLRTPAPLALLVYGKACDSIVPCWAEG